MTALSDAAVSRLKQRGAWPAFESGRYSIVDEIGLGGMGTVYLAIDDELSREVAIKIPNGLANASLERRLQLEARVLATLEHPGIVPIHDAGRLADGRLFYVMKRVNGRTLDDSLRSVSDRTDRLRIFERICEPVAFAHAKGFIHRDLKPENVMIGAFGEVMVMDWGTVKALETRQPSLDEHGTVIGTHGFMAPEQARGAVDEVDRRTDVYGLGALLFLLLTDQVTSSDHDGPDHEVEATLRKHRIARPLAAICAKALAVDPERRYQTVSALANDVAAYRAGRAVAAYRETVVERLARFGRTYRTAILLIVAYVIMRAMVAWLARW
jgi:eukaryotic-like serine/threonine-protein kinase